MHPIVYYTIAFAIAGAAGMAAGARKVAPAVKKQRWLKFATYILITATIIISIFFNFFFWLSIFISLASLLELCRVNYPHTRDKLWMVIVSFLIFSIIAGGFVLFADTFRSAFPLFIYFQVLVFDGFCQVAGQLWGRHPLVPSISPTKTIEGLAGGWICCIVAAVLAADWVQVSFLHAALFGLLTGFMASCGDILASYYKRKTGVKDYSNWLPGQGGFLDRFDSLLGTAFVYYILYLLNFDIFANQ
jgi:phosphatidate cytidylyltransferase